MIEWNSDLISWKQSHLMMIEFDRVGERRAIKSILNMNIRTHF